MYITTTLFTQEIIIQNTHQMRFLDKLVLKQKFDQKLTINAINCSMLKSPPIYDNDDIDNVATK